MTVRMLITIVLLLPASIYAEAGYEAWLRYVPLEGDSVRQCREGLPATVIPLGDSDLERSAAEELIRGVRGMAGRTLRLGNVSASGSALSEGAILLGGHTRIREVFPEIVFDDVIPRKGIDCSRRRSTGRAALSLVEGIPAACSTAPSRCCAGSAWAHRFKI